MFLKNLSKRVLLSSAAAVFLTLAAGCSMVIDDMKECPAELQLKFLFEYNMQFDDEIAKEVKSLNVWAFNSTGGLVWSEAVSGEDLAKDNYIVKTPLGEGTYDFVTWCGLESNPDFTLATYTPASKEELEVKLKTIAEEGANVSSSNIQGLYHGMVLNSQFIVDPYAPTYKTVEIPLTKDTNNIHVMLQHTDGTAIENQDFTVAITDGNAWLGWNNTVLPGSPLVTYKPWDVKYGQVAPPGSRAEKEITVASLVYEFSTNRLMANADARLTIRRNFDGETIVDINLIEYLLQIKDHYGSMSDQEYLDREDDYTIVFFVSKGNDWYSSAGIYINNWVVVPPQNEEF